MHFFDPDAWSECYRSVSSREELRQQIIKDTEQYLAKGKAITVVPICPRGAEHYFKTKIMSSMDKARSKNNAIVINARKAEARNNAKTQTV